jgi:hypothetical protein
VSSGAGSRLGGTAAWDRGGGATDMWAWPQCWAFERIQIGQLNSNSFQLHLIQNGIPELKQFEIKYGREVVEEGNNFLHMNLFRFKMDLDLKIWGNKV